MLLLNVNLTTRYIKGTQIYGVRFDLEMIPNRGGTNEESGERSQLKNTQLQEKVQHSTLVVKCSQVSKEEEYL